MTKFNTKSFALLTLICLFFSIKAYSTIRQSGDNQALKNKSENLVSKIKQGSEAISKLDNGIKNKVQALTSQLSAIIEAKAPPANYKSLADTLEKFKPDDINALNAINHIGDDIISLKQLVKNVGKPAVETTPSPSQFSLLVKLLDAKIPVIQRIGNADLKTKLINLYNLLKIEEDAEKVGKVRPPGDLINVLKVFTNSDYKAIAGISSDLQIGIQHLAEKNGISPAPNAPPAVIQGSNSGFTLNDRLQRLASDSSEQQKHITDQNSEIEALRKSNQRHLYTTAVLSATALALIVILIFLYMKQKSTRQQAAGVPIVNSPPSNESAGLHVPTDKGPGTPNINTIQTAPALDFSFTDAAAGAKYFFGETMVTAGPRKNFDSDPKDGDYGLGEDTAGLIIKNDNAFFWVMDGTSDSDKLSRPVFTADGREEEYFSSRLLAQTIGWHLHAQIAGGMSGTFNSENMLRQAIKLTQQGWEDKIARLDDASRTSLFDALSDKNNILQCSTTAVFGMLNLNGTLDVCRVGDTKVIAYPSSNTLARSTGRQFVTLQQQNGLIKLLFNDFDDLRSQSIRLGRINTVMVMTDGMSNHMESWLKTLDGIDFTDQKIREAFTHMKQKTYDDKALCIIQIKA